MLQGYTMAIVPAILHPKNCLPVVENGLLFAQRVHSARYAPQGNMAQRMVPSPPACAG